MMKAVSVFQTTQPLCSVTGHKLGPLIANCLGVILRGAGLSAEDLGFESLLCQYQLTKCVVNLNVGLCLDPVIGVCKGAFLGKLVALLYTVLLWACV